jgi:hypothetical protein
MILRLFGRLLTALVESARFWGLHFLLLGQWLIMLMGDRRVRIVPVLPWVLLALALGVGLGLVKDFPVVLPWVRLLVPLLRLLLPFSGLLGRLVAVLLDRVPGVGLPIGLMA